MSSMRVLFTAAIIVAACSSSRVAVVAFFPPPHATRHHHPQPIIHHHHLICKSSMRAMEELADDDLVALPFDGYLKLTSPTADDEEEAAQLQLRLCVIRNQQYIYPLIRHEDDVETDLFLDPRYIDKAITLKDIMQWWIEHHYQQSSVNNDEKSNNEITATGEVQYYGVGWYGQRPVPSLGGGPGYGAEADEVWSIEEDVLEQLLSEDGVDLPVIDVGMAHGEKARGGALF